MKIIKALFIILGFVLFLLSAFLLFEPSSSPTGFFVYTPNLAIINTNNNVPLNSNLEIEFITKGTNDLTINVDILELRCNDKFIGKSNEFKDYRCDETSSLTAKILSRKTEINIKFGNNIQQAINIAP
ncbi:MAG: hypothetical protein V3V78_00200 [Candidatus Woesearchaeota archaeon]